MQKYIRCIISVFLILACIELVGCSNSKKYTINFDSCGGPFYSSISTSGNEHINLPTPYRQGYFFDGWFTEKNGNGDKIFSNSFIDSRLEKNITLYASWLEYYSQPISKTNYTNYLYVNFQFNSSDNYATHITISCKTNGNYKYIAMENVYINVCSYRTITFTGNASIPLSIPNNKISFDIINNVYGSVKLIRKPSA